jgi:hypothetical protein
MMKKDFECTAGIASKTRGLKPAANPQKILVFQQNNSGEKKIEGIRQYGDNRFTVEVVSINETLPEIIDDTTKYIPRNFQADLVLDYLKHPDLSHDLAALCRDKKIPVVASGKKLHVEGVLTPPT